MRFLVAAVLLVDCLRVKARLQGGARQRSHARSQPSDVLITEIMFNPSACRDSDGEWIELYNNGSAAVDLDGWTLGDSKGNSRLSPVTLAPGSYHIAARSKYGCGGLDADDTFTFSLNNGRTGDTATLSDGSGLLVDQHSYSEGDCDPGYTTQRKAGAEGSPTSVWVQGIVGGSPRQGYGDAAAGGSSVKITEIFFKPLPKNSGGGGLKENWIELYNDGPAAVDLTDWTVGAGMSAVTLKPFHLAPGTYFLLAKDFRPRGDLKVDQLLDFSLNESGDTVMTLKDQRGKMVDFHLYSGYAADTGHSTKRRADATGHPTDIWEQGLLGGSPRAGYGSDDGGWIAPVITKYTRTYGHFQLELLCDKPMDAGYAYRFTYELVGPDKANYRRDDDFHYDYDVPFLPRYCQQRSMKPYKHKKCHRLFRKANKFCFDRGHLVMANHMDNNETDIHESNYMTNVLPQAAGFNQKGGAWLATENIIECGRDISSVKKQVIFGGALFTDDSNDYFLDSHGIPTPDIFWKVVVRHYSDDTTPEVIAWILPNNHTTTEKRLDKYLVNTTAIELMTGDDMPELPDVYAQSAHQSGVSWENPRRCNLSRL